MFLITADVVGVKEQIKPYLCNARTPCCCCCSCCCETLAFVDVLKSPDVEPLRRFKPIDIGCILDTENFAVVIC